MAPTIAMVNFALKLKPKFVCIDLMKEERLPPRVV